MSPPQRPVDHVSDRSGPIEDVLDARQANTMPASAATDPEAFTSIELTVAPVPSAQQKIDDPYLVCFDDIYDSEK